MLLHKKILKNHNEKTNNCDALVSMIEFESLHELVETLEKECADWQKHEDATKKHYRNLYSYLLNNKMPDSWASTISYKKLRHNLEYGLISDYYNSMYQKAKKELVADNPQCFHGVGINHAKRKRRISDVGDEIDIDRVLSGVPEHWSMMHRGAKRQKVRLGVSIGANAGVKTIEYVSIPATALATVVAQELEKRGHATEIYYIQPSVGVHLFKNNEDIANFLPGGSVRKVKVKSAEERFDENRIMSLAHSGLFRILMFMAKAYQNVLLNKELPKMNLSEVKLAWSLGRSHPSMSMKIKDGPDYKQDFPGYDPLKFVGIDYLVGNTEDPSKVISNILDKHK